MGSYDTPLTLTRSTVAESYQKTDIAEGEDVSPTLEMMKPGLTARDYLLPKIIRANKYDKDLIYGLKKKVPDELLYKKEESMSVVTYIYNLLCLLI